MTGVIIWHPKGASGWNHLHLAASTGDIATLKQLIRLSKQASEISAIEGCDSHAEILLYGRTQLPNFDTSVTTVRPRDAK